MHRKKPATLVKKTISNKRYPDPERSASDRCSNGAFCANPDPEARPTRIKMHGGKMDSVCSYCRSRKGVASSHIPAERMPSKDSSDAIAWVERVGMTPVKGGYLSSYFDKIQKPSFSLERASPAADSTEKGLGQAASTESTSTETTFNDNYSVFNAPVKRRRRLDPNQPLVDDGLVKSNSLDELSIFKLGGKVYAIDVGKNVMDFFRSKNVSPEAKNSLIDYIKALGNDPTDARVTLQSHAQIARLRMESMWLKGFRDKDGKIGVDKISVAALAASKKANLNMTDLKPSFKAMVDKINEKSTIYANPLFVSTLSTQSIKAVIAHENYHHIHRHYDIMTELVDKAMATWPKLSRERLWEYVNLAADVETNSHLEIDRLELALDDEENIQLNQNDGKIHTQDPQSDTASSSGKWLLAAASSWGGAVAGGLLGMTVHLITEKAIKQDFDVEVNIEEDSIEDIFFRILGSDKVKGQT